MDYKKYITNQEALEQLRAYKASRNQQDLAAFYKPFMRMVLAIGLKYYQDQMKAEDLVMNVYEVLLKKAHLHEVKNVSSWIYSIAKNQCLMDLRKKQREFSTDEFNFKAQAVESEQILHLFDGNEKEEELRALQNCLESLKAEQKQCVKEFYLEQKTYKQIAEEQQLELKKVKSFIQNGKRNLRICMENNG